MLDVELNLANFSLKRVLYLFTTLKKEMEIMIVELIFEKRKKIKKGKKLLFKKKNTLPATLRSNKKEAF